MSQKLSSMIFFYIYPTNKYLLVQQKQMLKQLKLEIISDDCYIYLIIMNRKVKYIFDYLGENFKFHTKQALC